MLLYLIAITAVLASYRLFFMGSNRSLTGKHCYVTGASQGLGLALACLLAGRGAHVTIVARTQSKLDEAVSRIKEHRLNDTQRINCVAADLTNYDKSLKAFGLACKPFQGKAPDEFYSCVGGAGNVLGFFVDLTAQQLQNATDTNYHATLFTTHIVLKAMVEQKVRGRITLVSSVAGFFSLVGYSAYSGPKAAIRILADGLRNECHLYGINVHCYSPGGILSPGFELENECKPDLTKKIEEADVPQTPEVCAQKLMKGIDAGHFSITSDFIGDLARVSSSKVAPKANWLKDTLIGLSITRSYFLSGGCQWTDKWLIMARVRVGAMPKKKSLGTPTKASPAKDLSAAKPVVTHASDLTSYQKRALSVISNFVKNTKAWNSTLLSVVLPAATRIVHARNEIEATSGSSNLTDKDDLRQSYVLAQSSRLEDLHFAMANAVICLEDCFQSIQLVEKQFYHLLLEASKIKGVLFAFQDALFSTWTMARFSDTLAIVTQNYHASTQLVASLFKDLCDSACSSSESQAILSILACRPLLPHKTSDYSDEWLEEICGVELPLVL